MSLLATVTELLEREGIAHAAIGAMALAAHGVARATADIDLLVVDRRVLGRPIWRSSTERGLEVEIHEGDADDPLAGVVRIERDEELPVELVVGKTDWQREILDRAVPLELFGATVPVAAPADLILLKLYAGGMQDRTDIASLLEQHPAAAQVRDDVEARLDLLDARATQIWVAIARP